MIGWIVAIGVVWLALACATVIGYNLAKRHYMRTGRE